MPKAVEPMPESLSFAQLFQQFYAERRTGVFHVHLLHGEPVYVDEPCKPKRISLDKGPKKSARLTT